MVDFEKKKANVGKVARRKKAEVLLLQSQIQRSLKLRTFIQEVKGTVETEKIQGKGESLRDVSNKYGKERFIENTLILKPNLLICQQQNHGDERAKVSKYKEFLWGELLAPLCWVVKSSSLVQGLTRVGARVGEWLWFLEGIQQQSLTLICFFTFLTMTTLLGFYFKEQQMVIIYQFMCFI